MERLIADFTALDPEETFKSPLAALSTVLTCKLRERRARGRHLAPCARRAFPGADPFLEAWQSPWARRALRGLAATVREIKEEEDKYGRESNLASLYALHEDVPASARHMAVALDVFHFQALARTCCDDDGGGD
jgi:hypothetical protein